MYLIGVLVLIGTGVFWYKFVFTNSRNVFWGAVNNSLSINGYTAELDQTQGNQTLHQLVQLDATNQLKSRYFTRISQSSGQTSMSVSTETLGTQEANYTRYVSIDTGQTESTDAPADYSQVTNLWAKAENKEGNEAEGGGSRLTVQAILGPNLGSYLIPFGNISAEQRTDIVAEMKQNNLYKFSEDNVKKEFKNGRMVYTYEIEILPVAYMRAMQQVTSAMGLKEFDNLDPNDYASYQPLKGTVSIDVLSRQVTQTNGEGGYNQRYTSYGLPITQPVPQNTVTESELQQRIIEVQSSTL